MLPPGCTGLLGVVVVAAATLPMPPVGALVTVFVTVVAVVFFAPVDVFALAVVADPVATDASVELVDDGVALVSTLEVVVTSAADAVVVVSCATGFLLPPPPHAAATSADATMTAVTRPFTVGSPLH